MNESMLKHSIILRMILVAGLSLLLLIPTFFIEGLISERQKRQSETVAEVSHSWGARQELTGPVLTVPYVSEWKDEHGKIKSSSSYLHLLPSKLNIRGSVVPEIRHRGIYHIALYNARYHIEGGFNLSTMTALNIPAANIQWKEAFIVYGISDLGGIRDTVSLRWDGVRYSSLPGVRCNEVVKSGITFTPQLDGRTTEHTFSMDINLNGNTELMFVPVGEVTTVSMKSPWNSPSFIGQFLPVQYNIGAEKFDADWKVLSLNRNFPQAWKGNGHDVSTAKFGVRLFVPVDEYQKTERTVKYALLFIALMFLSFFLSELIAHTILHPVQYSLIGFALLLFYLLLLSVSEYLSFNTAYCVAAGAVIILIGIYTRWVTQRNAIPLVITLVLAILYGFLFITLQVEDYALLIGSIGLFLILGIVMFLTRKIDWFSPASAVQRPNAKPIE